MASKASNPEIGDEVLAAIGGGERAPSEERDLSAGDDVLAAISANPAEKQKPGIYDRLLEYAARGAKIPGGANTVKTVTGGINDVTNAITTGGVDLLGRLATGNRHPINPKYFEGKPQPASKILQDEYGWSPWAAQPVGLVAGAAADPTGRLTEAMQPVAEGLDKLSSGIYQTGFRNVSKVFPRLKQNRGTNAGEDFIEQLRRDRVLPSGSNAREVGNVLENYQHETLGNKMDEFVEPIKNNKYTDIGEIVAPYVDYKKKVSRDVAPEAIVNSFEDKLVTPELARIAGEGGVTVKDMIRKAGVFSDIASGKTGSQGDIYKEFAREDIGKQAAAKIAQGFRKFARKETIAANPASGPLQEGARNINPQEINDVYRTYGNIETAKPALAKMAEVEAGKTWTGLDTGLAISAGLGEMGHHGAGLLPLALLLGKKGNTYLKSPAGATRIGNALQTAGETGIWDKMLKRGLLQASDKEE